MFNLNSRTLNKFIIGEPGQASKTITFKEKEFKKELAPINARIDYGEFNGEKVVIMTYKV